MTIKTGDSSRDFAQYVSLALFVDGPPTFKPKIKEGELPPDAVYVVGFLPLVTQFYKDAKIHEFVGEASPGLQRPGGALYDRRGQDGF